MDIEAGPVLYRCSYIRRQGEADGYTDACVHAGRRTYPHTSRQYIHAYIHTYIHTYVHTYIHTYVHTCIVASMHPCIQASLPACFI